MFDASQDLVQLARLALEGTSHDVQLYVRKLARKLQKHDPKAAHELDALLSKSPTRKAALREYSPALPVDVDSRLDLVRAEFPVVLEVDPLWAPEINQKLLQVVGERSREQELTKAGLVPTKTILFVGNPGVGKSLSARWLARQLNRPLLTLHLAAVMSSYLGRTGVNVRQVLDHAKAIDCVLLLDELDAIAKRRDDGAEIGELKRLVTVLLQEIDNWPPSGLLIGATNHPDLLDPALWRRFDMIVDFPMPAPDQVREMVSRFVDPKEVGQYFDVLARIFESHSFSDIERDLLRAKREAIVFNRALIDVLPPVLAETMRSWQPRKRKAVAVELKKLGMTERDVRRWTGVSRDTIRQATRESA